MIKDKQLTRLQPPIVHKDDEQRITLDLVEHSLNENAKSKAIPIAFRRDKVKTGMFKKTIEDCLVIFHPKHKKNYCMVAIRLQRVDNNTHLLTHEFGTSKNSVKAASAEGAASATEGALKGAIVKGLLGPSKKKIEEENNWYYDIGVIIGEVVT